MDEKMIACYSMEEQKLISGLDKLFVEWEERLFEKWDNPNEMFVRDGFIPGYLKSKKKVLFIGRDSYDVWDGCWIGNVFELYSTGWSWGKWIDQIAFHKRMIKVAYSLGYCDAVYPEWECIPRARDLIQNEILMKKYGFAFMNLGKIGHGSESAVGTNADWKLIHKSVDISTGGSRNYIAEEINLLDPDIIISMNLSANKLVFELAFDGRLCEIDKNVDCNVYGYKINGEKRIPLLDVWHFSGSSGGQEGYYYYDVILKGLYKYNNG